MSNKLMPTTPEILLDDVDDADTIHSIKEFDGNVRRYPELYVRALNTVYLIGQNAVDEVVKFVGVEGEHTSVLHTLNQLFEAKLDIEIVFDEATEKAIASDSTVAKIINKKDRTQEEAFSLRRKRLLTYAQLVSDTPKTSKSSIAKAV